MSAIASEVAGAAPASATDYIGERVLDALLREDVGGCVSRAALRSPENLPASCAAYAGQADTWLEATHLGPGRLWIPVRPATFMQDWRGAGLPWLREEGGQVVALGRLEQVLAAFKEALPPAAAALFDAFVAECGVAIEHRELCERERERWFAQWRADFGAACGIDLPGWWARLLHYDRLGAFLDHPFYPTARAKLGFDAAALAAYSPEFAPRVELRWLALPRTLCHPSVEGEAGWPAAWPRMQDVGLPPDLADSHALVPVHPFMWDARLDAMLADAGLAGHAVRAPLPWLRVAPTLSVRTVALLDAPEWHLKLPLTIRTLGARNIRTIKPSTIGDGHRIQGLLGAIAAREPALAGRLLLTDEERGAHVDGRNFLGYILRRYPAAQLADSSAIAVAALGAAAPGGTLVAQEAADCFYAGKLDAFFDDYLDLTLRLHLLLWVRYGIALESNQQNSVVVLSHAGPRLRLLLKDNDAARIDTGLLARRWPDLAAHLAQLEDERIAVPDALPLAQMFTTITLQLNIAALVERLAAHGALGRPAAAWYAVVRAKIAAQLADLAAEGEDVACARQVLLEDARLYHKCLLVAATLADKTQTGAADVNKFYGRGAPNFLGAA